MKTYKRKFNEDISNTWGKIKDQVFELIESKNIKRCTLEIENTSTSNLDGTIYKLQFYIQDYSDYSHFNFTKPDNTEFTFDIGNRDKATLYTDYDYGIKLIGRDFTYRIFFE